MGDLSFLRPYRRHHHSSPFAERDSTDTAGSMDRSGSTDSVKNDHAAFGAATICATPRTLSTEGS